MKTLSGVALLCSALCALAQPFGLSGPAFAHLTVRPPNCWVDVMEYTNPSPPVATADLALATNLNDFSGHGLRWYDGSAPSGTNKHFFTRFGGCLSGFDASLSPMTVHPSVRSNAQLHVFNYTNRATIAIRVRYRTGNSGFVQSGEAGPPGTLNFTYAQLTGGTVFFDWGGGGDLRIQKTKPSDFDNQWVNVFFTRGATNASIWMGGPTGPITNWHSDLVTGMITNNAASPGAYVAPATGSFQCLGGMAVTNYYVKRILWWDYELPQADIEAWNRRMTELP